MFLLKLLMNVRISEGEGGREKERERGFMKGS